MEESEPVSLPPMSEALATIEPSLVYTEAKRQYEALVQASASESHVAMLKISDLNGCLWEDVTRELDQTGKLNLQIMCFAYKTKLRIMHFLNLLGDRFEWAQPLLELVRKHGRDSAFDVSGEQVKACPELRRFIATQQRELGINTNIPSDEDQTSSDPPTMFVIPTLLFAYPTTFFASLGVQGPLNIFHNSQNLLSYPAALLISMEPEIRDKLRDSPPTFWEPDKEQRHGPVYEKTKAEWKALFDHLLEDSHPLVIPKRGAIEVMPGDYGVTDLNIWCASWLAERGKKGTSEKGLAERKRLRESDQTIRIESHPLRALQYFDWIRKNQNGRASMNFTKWIRKQRGKENLRSADPSFSSTTATTTLGHKDVVQVGTSGNKEPQRRNNTPKTRSSTRLAAPG